jgi:hypothetical protein
LIHHHLNSICKQDKQEEHIQNIFVCLFFSFLEKPGRCAIYLNLNLYDIFCFFFSVCLFILCHIGCIRVFVPFCSFFLIHILAIDSLVFFLFPFVCSHTRHGYTVKGKQHFSWCIKKNEIYR